MDTYPCPACGGVADETHGCRSCGRAHDAVAAALSRLNQAMASLDDESRRLADNQSDLNSRRAQLQTQRQALTRAIALRLAEENRGPAEENGGQAEGNEGQAEGNGRPAAGGTRDETRTPPRQRGGGWPRTGGVPAGVETSPRSAQNTLLSLGGVLLAIAAIVIAAFFYTSSQTGGRAFVLAIATTLALGIPVLLARRTLTATAETIAAFGLLLVLLDGYAAYGADLAGITGVPAPLFAAILFALVAGVAAAYRLATHLRAPQFAALLALQPLLPLIAVHLGLGRDGFATVFALVAALNLGAVAVFTGAATGLSSGSWPRMLRELAWALFGASLALSAALAVFGLWRAASVSGALVSSGSLLLAAAVAVVAGQMAGRSALAHAASGAAALAIIACVSRVNALALPDYTLVLTAALAAGIAVASGFLPPSARQGAQVGSLVGALGVGAVVAISAAGTAVATVQAAVTPRAWAADLSAYSAQVHTNSWQVPAAAVLLAIVATAGTPALWRGDAAALGMSIVVFAAPGAGGVSWWMVPLLASVASSAATATSLRATSGRSALIRSGSAGVLGAYAVATSLARPELTATVCVLLTLVSVATTVLVVARPRSLGPYADRVADSAGGAASFTLPIAVATLAALADVPAPTLLALTVVATAAAVVAAALSQVAAQMPRTGSAGGALAASAGCVVLSLQLDGTKPADVALTVLLLGAAVATAASRAFELSPGGLVEGVRSIPAAVGSLADSVDGTVDRPVPRTRRRLLGNVDGITLGAALATAALIVALTRLLAVAAAGIGLVTTTAMVFVVSLGIMVLPAAWRRGPRLGASAVAAAVGVATATIAATEAARTVAAAMPWWSADLATWSERVSSWAPYGWQVPASLLLAAAAAWALLPAPDGPDIAFVTLCLAGLATPAAFRLSWWAPIAIAGCLGVAAGLRATAASQPDRVTHRRLGLAALLGLYAVAAAAASPGSTALALSAVIAAGVLVTAVARLRADAPPVVAGIATAASLLAAPGAAATIAVATGVGRTGVLAGSVGMAAFGALVVAALRAARVPWLAYPAMGVGASALVVAVATVPDLAGLQVWAAAAALPALAAAACTDRRAATSIIVTCAAPAALFAAIGSAPAWLTALIGPYQTLRQVWQGYAVAAVPENASTAVVTLLLLAAGGGAAALVLGGERFFLAAILPPLAAWALVAPTAIGAPPGVAPWVALTVAIVTGLGAALSPPTLPGAARLLRGTAGVVCTLTGAAGIAGSLATRGGTLAAIAATVIAALLAATVGRDPAVRMVSWLVGAAAAFAFPVTAFAAADADVRSAAFGVLAVCTALVAIAWSLARTPARRGEAGVIELSTSLGAALALLLALGSARHCAAVLTICGLLLGACALRRDRPAQRRQWLVRSALAAEVGACWLLLYSVEVGLPEAYTLPFAAVALLAGALELRARPELSSWAAYGPALAGGFLPSLVLVLIGEDVLWRWVTLFVAAIATVITGSWRRRLAPVVAGSAVAVGVAVIEMIRLLLSGAIAGAVLVAVAGVVLIVFGAVSEQRLRGALRKMS